jgi:hypothetical protein
VGDSGFRVNIASFERVQAILNKVAQNVPKAASKACLDAGRVFVKEFKSRRLSGHGPNSLGRISGDMARRTEAYPLGERGSAKGVGVGVRVGVPYAKSHEAAPLGKAPLVIRAKNGPYLIFKVQSRTATGLTHKDTGRAILKRGKAVWVKVKKVTIPPRLNLLVDWKDWYPSMIHMIEASIVKAFGDARA